MQRLDAIFWCTKGSFSKRAYFDILKKYFKTSHWKYGASPPDIEKIETYTILDLSDDIENMHGPALSQPFLPSSNTSVGSLPVSIDDQNGRNEFTTAKR